DMTVFVRELIQNALDASRCSLVLRYKQNGEPQPAWLPDAPEELRAKWPVHITLKEVAVEDSISGQTEPQQTVIIEDNGIGMSRDIIQKYLLQIGRSFYTSQDFRRTYGFVPTSRFGLGFLSVFAVSDRITVDTLSELPGNEPI